MEDMDHILNRHGIGENIIISAIQVKKTYEKMCAKVIGNLHLTQNEADIILFLSQNKEIDTAAEIARYRCLSKSQVCKSVDALAKNGYLLIRQDPLDRRYQHLHLSEKGVLLTERLNECRMDFVNQVKENLTEGEIKALSDILSKIRKNVTKGR